jgi:3-oxoacyl-[acyl-carrier-protein] synthase-3
VKQEGQQVFKFAVRKMMELSERLLEQHGYTARDLKLLIPHQANRRIIAATVDRLGLNEDQYVVNLDRYGNTTCATIPLATRDALEAGKLKKGDLVLFAAVGAGYTAGSILWRWNY